MRAAQGPRVAVQGDAAHTASSAVGDGGGKRGCGCAEVQGRRLPQGALATPEPTASLPDRSLAGRMPSPAGPFRSFGVPKATCPRCCGLPRGRWKREAEALLKPRCVPTTWGDGSWGRGGQGAPALRPAPPRGHLCLPRLPHPLLARPLQQQHRRPPRGFGRESVESHVPPSPALHMLVLTLTGLLAVCSLRPPWATPPSRHPPSPAGS